MQTPSVNLPGSSLKASNCCRRAGLEVLSQGVENVGTVLIGTVGILRNCQAAKYAMESMSAAQEAIVSIAEGLRDT